MDQSKKTPMLILNIQINDSETESIRIYGLSEAEAKIDLFCKNYQISDRDVIRKIKARLRVTLKEKYPFLGAKEVRPYLDGHIHNAKHGTLGKPKRSNRTGADKSLNKIGIQSLVYSKKTEVQIINRQSLVGQINNQQHSSYNNSLKPRPLTMLRTKANKENKKHLKRPTTNIIHKYDVKPNIYTDNPQQTQYLVSSITNNANLSSIYINPALQLINKISTPQIPNNVTGTAAFADFDLDSAAKIHMSNYSYVKLSNKSSFYEPNQPDRHRSVLGSHKVNIVENRVRNELMDNDPTSIKSFNKSVANKTDKETLRGIFDKLDCEGSGLIGPSNVNLRQLTAGDMKMIEGIIVDIFKRDQDSGISFKEFCNMIKGQSK